MIDSIKFLIPLPETDLITKIEGNLTRFKKEDLKTGDVKFEFFSSQVELGSHNRTISIKSTKEPLGLFIEFSVPKYAKGNNVEMLQANEIEPFIKKLYSELCTFLNYQLPHYSTWPVYRLDICYNWILKDKEEAIQAIDFIKLIDYPRKKKHMWNTSVMYQGSAYTVKFYHKGSEFIKHDFKKISELYSHSLQYWANRIVRFEVAIKRIYLEKFLGHKTVYLEHISDNDMIIETLQHYLGIVFRYINLTTMKNADIKTVLYKNFTKPKATRLFMFHKNYYHDEDIKSMLIGGGMNRSTIYRYKKDLKRVGIGPSSEFTQGASTILEKFIIPSPDAKFDLPTPEYYS